MKHELRRLWNPLEELTLVKAQQFSEIAIAGFDVPAFVIVALDGDEITQIT